MTPLVEVRSLKKYFRLPGGWLTGDVRYVYAVDGVDLSVEAGEVFGLVGESGCGKTTLGRILLRLLLPTAGQVLFDGQDLSTLKGKAMRHMRQQMQIVFQNPLSSLSPRLKIEQVVAEPLITHHASNLWSSGSASSSCLKRLVWANNTWIAFRMSFQVGSASVWQWRAPWRSTHA